MGRGSGLPPPPTLQSCNPSPNRLRSRRGSDRTLDLVGGLAELSRRRRAEPATAAPVVAEAMEDAPAAGEPPGGEEAAPASPESPDPTAGDPSAEAVSASSAPATPEPPDGG